MPTLKTYVLFISYIWRHTDNSEYYRIVDLLDRASNFEWRNYSVPEHDPLETKSNKELSDALDHQIKPINCFLIISGMYVTHREWIKKELEIAKSYSKPIIGILPRGQERTPVEVQDAKRWWAGTAIASSLLCASGHYE